MGVVTRPTLLHVSQSRATKHSSRERSFQRPDNFSCLKNGVCLKTRLTPLYVTDPCYKTQQLVRILRQELHSRQVLLMRSSYGTCWTQGAHTRWHKDGMNLLVLGCTFRPGLEAAQISGQACMVVTSSLVAKEAASKSEIDRNPGHGRQMCATCRKPLSNLCVHERVCMRHSSSARRMKITTAPTVLTQVAHGLHGPISAQAHGPSSLASEKGSAAVQGSSTDSAVRDRHSCTGEYICVCVSVCPCMYALSSFVMCVLRHVHMCVSMACLTHVCELRLCCSE